MMTGVGVSNKAPSMTRFCSSSSLHALRLTRTTSAYSARMIGRVLGIETGTADVAEFIRRLVFSTLTGNGDIHLKNWSLIYSDRRTPCGDFQPEGTLCSCPG
jgi:serine/threonine protein kinase HipA of HipAB toxin-antitoxin module